LVALRSGYRYEQASQDPSHDTCRSTAGTHAVDLRLSLLIRAYVAQAALVHEFRMQFFLDLLSIPHVKLACLTTTGQIGSCLLLNGRKGINWS
jgi:hypothetical protein